MKRIYAEIGVENKTFLSTEIEKGKKEYRLNKFVIPRNLDEVYLRIWIIRLVMIISFFKGFFFRIKDKSRFKVLIGFGGQE